MAKVDDEETILAAVEEVIQGKRRMIVVAADATTARQWARYRGVKRGFYIAEDAMILTGLGPESDVVVLVDGYQAHRRFAEMRRRLSIEQSREVPILRDRLPAGEGPATPQIGGAFLMAASVNRMPFNDDQGDTFVVGFAGGSIVLRRSAVEQLGLLVDGWLAGEPVPDPQMDRLLEIKASIEATGDLYGRGETADAPG